MYKTDRYVYNFQKFETIRSFSKNIFAGKITLGNSNKDQSDLLNNFIDFNKRTKLRDIEKVKLKQDATESLNALYKSRKVIL